MGKLTDKEIIKINNIDRCVEKQSLTEGVKVRGVSGIFTENFLLSAMVVFELLKVDRRVRSQFISMQTHIPHIPLFL